MARKGRNILPFRIPFFRIFYSTTYTIVLLVTFFFLAATPGELLLEAVQASAYQYVFIIGGVYILTALIAIFIYTSRLYTNRIVLAAVGKSYIPVEDGETGKKIRTLIVSQLDRSAIISWESKPRDVIGEHASIKHAEAFSEKKKKSAPNSPSNALGTIVSIDVKSPPWGTVQHRGWTAPSSSTASEYPANIQFEAIMAELPHLLEARAVSLGPPDPNGEHDFAGQTMPDHRVVELLRRQERAGLREYLTQLSYLRLVDLNGAGGTFLRRYEKARFSGRPPTYNDFKALMAAVALVMDQMTALDTDIISEIRAQVSPTQSPSAQLTDNGMLSPKTPRLRNKTSSMGSYSGNVSPVTAQTRLATPYLSQGNASFESAESIIHSTPIRRESHGWSAAPVNPEAMPDSSSFSSGSLASDADSVVRHDI